MKTYVVAAGRPSALLIRRILDASTLPHLVVVSGGDDQVDSANAARSLHHTSRGAPVALLLDARTHDADFVREQEQELGSLLRMGLPQAPLRLFMAVPELETVLFNDPHALERTLGCPIPADALFEAQFRPRVVLQRLLEETHPGCDLAWVAERIDREAACAYVKYPLISSLIEFLRHPGIQSPYTAAA